MADTTDTPDAGASSTWPQEPPAQILLVVSLASAVVFVSGGGFLPFTLIGLAMVAALAFERFGTVTVPEAVFGSLPAGSLPCVQRHGGRLGIAWLSVERCLSPPQATRTPGTG